MARKPGVTVGGLQRRASILRKAEELIARDGFHEMTMDSIAEELDASKSAIYHYFKQKDDLLFAIRHETLSSMIAKQRERMNSSSSRIELVHEMLIEDIKLVSESPEKYLAFLELKGKLSPDREAEIGVLEREYYLMLVATVQDAIDEGDMRPVNPRLVVQAILGMVNQVQYWFNPSGRQAYRLVADGLWDILFCGITSEDGRRKSGANGSVPIKAPRVEFSHTERSPSRSRRS